MTATALILSQASSAFTQVLVPNGGFESNTGFPEGPAQWDKCIGWNNVNGITGNFGEHGTPDYHHTSGAAQANMPNSQWATLLPHEGEAVLGFLTYAGNIDNWREYLSCKLIQPLVVGASYDISFWITNGETRYTTGGAVLSPARNSSDHIGLCFSTAPLRQGLHEPIERTPQVESTGEVWSTDWQLITFSFKADSAFEYLTIGNFYPDSETSTTVMEPGGPAVSAYYYIDAFSLSAKPEILGPVSICEGDSATLTSPFGSTGYWATSSGQPLGTDAQLIVSPVQTTTYAYHHATDTLFHTVVVKPLPEVHIVGDTAVCDGEEATFSVIEKLGAYTWSTGDHTQEVSTDEEGIVFVVGTLDGCTAADTAYLRIKTCPEEEDTTDIDSVCCGEITLRTLNVFTPDGDHINDDFQPMVGTNITDLQFLVYDRWGLLLYESDVSRPAWDGAHRSAPCPDGTYYWIVYEVNGAPMSFCGEVTLLR